MLVATTDAAESFPAACSLMDGGEPSIGWGAFQEPAGSAVLRAYSAVLDAMESHIASEQLQLLCCQFFIVISCEGALMRDDNGSVDENLVRLWVVTLQSMAAHESSRDIQGRGAGVLMALAKSYCAHFADNACSPDAEERGSDDLASEQADADNGDGDSDGGEAASSGEQRQGRRKKKKNKKKKKGARRRQVGEPQALRIDPSRPEVVLVNLVVRAATLLVRASQRFPGQPAIVFQMALQSVRKFGEVRGCAELPESALALLRLEED